MHGLGSADGQTAGLLTKDPFERGNFNRITFGSGRSAGAVSVLGDLLGGLRVFQVTGSSLHDPAVRERRKGLLGQGEQVSARH